jgi:hypothetical protein
MSSKLRSDNRGEMSFAEHGWRIYWRGLNDQIIQIPVIAWVWRNDESRPRPVTATGQTFTLPDSDIILRDPIGNIYRGEGFEVGLSDEEIGRLLLRSTSMHMPPMPPMLTMGEQFPPKLPKKTA